MEELKTVSKLVKFCLEQDKQARNSDNVLYLQILEHYSEKRGIDIHKMTVPTFLLGMKQHGFPAFETVRRSRQKVQEIYPDLAATETVGRRRTKKEGVYREFAASDAV